MSFELLKRIQKLEERCLFLEHRVDQLAKNADPEALPKPVRDILKLPKGKA